MKDGKATVPVAIRLFGEAVAAAGIFAVCAILNNSAFRRLIVAVGIQEDATQIFALDLLLLQLQYVAMFVCVWCLLGRRGAVLLALVAMTFDFVLLGGGVSASPAYGAELAACVCAGVSGCVVGEALRMAWLRSAQR